MIMVQGNYIPLKNLSIGSVFGSGPYYYKLIDRDLYEYIPNNIILAENLKTKEIVWFNIDVEVRKLDDLLQTHLRRKIWRSS